MSVKKIVGADANKLVNALQGLSNSEAEVGWFESAKYEETGIPVAAVMAQNEYGNPALNIPSRSFMRTTVNERSNQWNETILKSARAVVTGRTTAGNVLEGMASLAAGNVREKIASIQSPPLKQSTINARKRKRANKRITGNLTKPLVDTRHAINTLTYSVS